MTASDSKGRAKEVFSQAEELERALECETLQEMLQGRAGVFTFRYLFINEYINCFTLFDSNLSNKLEGTGLKKKKTPTNIFDIIKDIIRFAKIIIHKNRHDPLDLIFISRNRKARIKTRSGYAEGDYIFYSVMNELERNYQEVDFTMYLIDDTYLKYMYATPLDILQSVYLALEKSLLWSFRGKYVVNYLTEQGCNYAARYSKTFFCFRPLLRNALLGLSIKTMFAAYRPRVIVSNDDCLYTKPPTDQDIKTIVLQSASVVEAIEDCRALIFRDSRLQPDFFLCSGRKSGEIKAKVGAAKKVIVTGQPRYDILFHLNELYCKEDIKERYGIKPGQKTVLWATQTHGFGDEENRMNLQAVLGALQSLEDVILLIKQHPAETTDNTELIKELSGRYNAKVVITPKDSDTYEQLFVCDLMITRHSTTALEAVAMGKPVIILNLSGKADLVDYVREKVAAGVYEEKDLRKTIERLLQDDRELAENRDAYLDWILFKIDGKATERVVNTIFQMVGSEERHYE